MATIKATPRMRYRQHKSNAKLRGIEFDMTFEEWWAIWEPHYSKRGTGLAGLQMCRQSDEGAYRPGNVRIDTGARNLAEAWASRTRRSTVEAWRIHGEDRSELRTWVEDRIRMFRDPSKILEEAQEECCEDDDGP